MRTPPLSEDDTLQEHDVWWGSYAGSAMVPSFVLCGVVTASIVLLTGSGYLLFGLGGKEMRYTAYALIAPLWLFQFLRWLYRVGSFNYRLTSRRLFRSRGFLYPVEEAVLLADVTQVVVEQTLWERRFRIGSVRIFREKKGLPSLVLEGVREPERIAVEIQTRARPVVPS